MLTLQAPVAFVIPGGIKRQNHEHIGSAGAERQPEVDLAVAVGWSQLHSSERGVVIEAKMPHAQRQLFPGFSVGIVPINLEVVNSLPMPVRPGSRPPPADANGVRGLT